MRILPFIASTTVATALVTGCALEPTGGTHSSFSGGSSFNRDYYFATEGDLRSALTDICRQRGLLVKEHPTGVISHYFEQDSKPILPSFTYVATVAEIDDSIRFWSHCESHEEFITDERKACFDSIETEIHERIKATGAPKDCYHYSVSNTDIASESRFDLTSAAQVAEHVGDIVTIRGPAERRQDGIFMVGPDVLVQLPQWCDTRDEPQWTACAKGRLRLVRAANDASSTKNPARVNDAQMQDVASGATPALYVLEK